jgi:hypothetical protein
MPIKIPEKKGMKYRPSNGTEGERFIVEYCDRCVHEPQDDKSQGCKILIRTMVHDVNDPEYPKEWVYDDEGVPKCTEFEKRED